MHTIFLENQKRSAVIIGMRKLLLILLLLSPVHGAWAEETILSCTYDKEDEKDENFWVNFENKKLYRQESPDPKTC